MASTVCGSVEWFERHWRLLARLEELRRSKRRDRLLVLDFGGAAGALAKTVALHGLASHYFIVVTEVDVAALASAPAIPTLLARVRTSSAASLPFRDHAFDAAVSSDVFEHIPRASRHAWARELERVARYGQLHTVPCLSQDGSFAGDHADRTFQDWHVERFGLPDHFTAEHQQHGIPSDDDLAHLFPGARLTGFLNSEVWLQLMRDQFLCRSFRGRLVSGLRFMRMTRRAALPPFKNCLVDALEAPPASSAA